MTTAILLGAGASKPFGFPLGPELKQIVTQCARDNGIQQRLKQLGCDSSHLTDLVECLRYGRFATIDEFLDAKKSFREVGGYIIAESILQRENRDNIFPIRDWFHFLYSKLHKKALSGETPNVVFVSLNYDRSLEYFFSMVAKYDCREDEEEKVRRTLSAIRVYHPHGSLGSLSDLPFGCEKGPPDAEKMRQAGRRIQIISDRLEESPAFVEAQKVLASADRILFIGFAYHPSTLGTLLKNVNLEKTELAGTTLNLDPSRVEEVRKWAGIRIQLVNNDAKTFIDRQPI